MRYHYKLYNTIWLIKYPSIIHCKRNEINNVRMPACIVPYKVCGHRIMLSPECITGVIRARER